MSLILKLRVVSFRTNVGPEWDPVASHLGLEDAQRQLAVLLVVVE